MSPTGSIGLLTIPAFACTLQINKVTPELEVALSMRAIDREIPQSRRNAEPARSRRPLCSLLALMMVALALSVPVSWAASDHAIEVENSAARSAIYLSPDCLIPIPLVSPLPFGLTGSAAAHVPERHRIYLFGGMSTDGARSDILEVNTDTFVVTLLPVELAEPLSLASAAYAPSREKVYIFGGNDASGHPVSTILSFDPKSLEAPSAISLSPLPPPRAGSCVEYVPDEDIIFLLGGQDDQGPVRDIAAFDVQAETYAALTATLPSSTSLASSAYAPGRGIIYVFGGNDGASSLDDIVAFDTHDMQVTTLATSLPTAREQSAAAYSPWLDRAFILGGLRDEIKLADIIEFDPNIGSASIHPGSPLPQPLHGQSSAHIARHANHHQILIMGGTGPQGASWDMVQIRLGCTLDIPLLVKMN
jgi:hypothetical protein